MSTNQITENYLEVGPAYGRDYKSQAKVREAFESGKDFEMLSFEYGGKYCSIRDFAPGVTVNLRYRRHEMVLPYKVKAS
jgi:hypothetical protein